MCISKGSLLIQYFAILRTSMKEGAPEGQSLDLNKQELLKITKEMKLWKDIIAHVAKGHGS